MGADAERYLLRTGTLERLFNRAFGLALRFGIGLSHNYLLQVRGRNSGKLYSTPVDVLDLDGKRFLVCGRGRTQWVRNAEASGEVTLAKGVRRETFSVRQVPVEERPRVLKAYLDRFKLTVQRYFPVSAGSAESDFVPYASRYPVFYMESRAKRSSDSSDSDRQ